MAKAKIGKATPQEAGAAWNAGFTAGSENARRTVQSGQVDWMNPTVAAEQRASAGVAAAFASGRWRQGVQQAGNQAWQQGMLTKGVPHMAAGSQTGAQHYAAFRAQWDAFVQQAKAQLGPRGTYEQNKARSTAMQDAFHNAKGKFKGLWKRGGGA